MKKLSAILFIVILLVNSGGYRFVIAFTGYEKDRSLSMLLDEHIKMDQRGATELADEDPSTLELFGAYNGGYGNAANFNLIAVQTSNAANHVIFKRNLNEYDGKDMRYDMETAQSSPEPVAPKPLAVIIVPNYLVEYDAVQVIVSNISFTNIICYPILKDVSLPILCGTTPHQPPELVG